MIDLKINPQWRDLIPPISKEEYELLEKSIMRSGCRDQIITWKGFIIDGHNRYKICKEHNIKFDILDMSIAFSSEDELKIWIIQNQLGRRNLPLHERARLALLLKPSIEEKAEEREMKGKADPSQKSDKGRTDEKLAQIANVSRDTIRKVDVIEKEAPPKIKEAARKGKISVNKAYSETRSSKEKDEQKKISRALGSMRFETLRDAWKGANNPERKLFLRHILLSTRDQIRRYIVKHGTEFTQEDKQYYSDIDERSFEILLQFGVYYDDYLKRMIHKK